MGIKKIDRKRKKVPFNMYTNKAVHKDLIKLINNKKRRLQEIEDKRFGKKSQVISFVYATKIFAKEFKK